MSPLRRIVRIPEASHCADEHRSAVLHGIATRKRLVRGRSSGKLAQETLDPDERLLEFR
jgi:hypothetical protein